MTHIKYHLLNLFDTPYSSQPLTRRPFDFFFFLIILTVTLSQIHQARCRLLIYAKIGTDFILG